MNTKTNNNNIVAAPVVAVTNAAAVVTINKGKESVVQEECNEQKSIENEKIVSNFKENE